MLKDDVMGGFYKGSTLFGCYTGFLTEVSQEKLIPKQKFLCKAITTQLMPVSFPGL